MIRAARPADAGPIARIYNHYIAATTITFEEEPVSTAEIDSRIRAVQAVPLPWLVAEHDGAVVGYAYAARWEERSAYRYTVETTVYVAHDFAGRGIGRSLYAALLAELTAMGKRVALGVIALPNEASVAMHERFGFVKVGHFTKVGFKFGNWIDVGYWQRSLTA